MKARSTRCESLAASGCSTRRAPQELWEAVTGSNPSRFRSPTRPVEGVSWADCQGFVTRLNGLLEGLELSLPSEAQWEYACRAGTTGATYAGDLEIVGARNAPRLDGIAWYGGNCGVGYELGEGEDISSWAEKQYALKRGGTHPVGGKAPNRWGLYDMLGNVWEWCQDSCDSQFYEKSPRDDPVAPPGASAARVLRGGSWSSYARYVRAASRCWCDPGNRYDDLGFRCGEFQSSGPARAEPGVERVVSGSEPGAEHGSDRESPSGTRWLTRLDEDGDRLVMQSLPSIRILSDVEELVIGS